MSQQIMMMMLMMTMVMMQHSMAALSNEVECSDNEISIGGENHKKQEEKEALDFLSFFSLCAANLE